MLATGWSEAQKRAYVLADNQLTLNAGWNPELLRLELGDLKELDFDLGLLGFGDAELAALTANPGLTDPDEVPEPPAVPIVQRGEVWQLGRHRLMCGDCTNAEDVARALGGVQPHLMVTNPPYGVEYDPDWRNRADLANGKPYGDRAIGQVTNDDQSDWSAAYKLSPARSPMCGSRRNPHNLNFGARSAPVVLISACKSFGPSSSFPSAEAIITFNTKAAFMPFGTAKPVIGKATERNRPFGKFPSHRNPKPATARRSRSSA